jgi:hypothetical protein
MSNENSTTKARTWPKKVLKIIWIGCISLAALFFVVRLTWRFSGSNQWEFIGEQNGVKAYTLKEPGSDVKQVKGVMRLHSTMDQLVSLMQDPDICDDLGCTESRTLEWVDEQLQFDYFRLPLPFPLKTREFVVRTQYYRNPHNNEVILEVSAAPDKIPPNPCCFRVTEMNNTMRFTPLGNGEVEMEYIVKQNEGGFIPDLFVNLMRPNVMFYAMPRIREFVGRPKYQNAKFSFLAEK